MAGPVAGLQLARGGGRGGDRGAGGWMIAGREGSLALLRLMVSNIDLTGQSALCSTGEGWGRRVKVG